MQDLKIDIAALFASHESERFTLHTRRLNEQMVRVLRTIGYDVGFSKGVGQYLYDGEGGRYLDLLSGYGVFAVGRNHPAIRTTLKSVLDAHLPNLVQIQGKGVILPSEEYLKGAEHLCRRYETLFVTDEIQTGIGRTGKFLAGEHWGIEPDMVLLAKALSGGHVPVGAVLMRKRIYDKVFNRMDRAVVHGSTFGKNDLAMAAGIATLEIMEADHVTENAARTGQRLLRELSALADNYELVKDVRGKGLMIGVEFGSPSSLKLKASWNVLETASKGLFCQLIAIPLFKQHKILTQVAGHGSHTVKLIPPLIIDDADCDWIVRAFDDVIADSHHAGAVWSLGKTLVQHAMRASA